MGSRNLIIIGGGAAGIFCAINAARLNRGLNVTVLEKTSKLLSKVKVSGGGRCNVTHACFEIEKMSRYYPRGGNFVKRAFHQFFTTDTIKWFEERGIRLKTESDGRMFPESNSSQTIIDCFLNELTRYNVDVMLNSEVKNISVEKNKFNLLLAHNEILMADMICIAVGGYPKNEMFNWIKATGHAINPPVPSLFTFNLSTGHAGLPGHDIRSLQGISVENVKLKIAGTKLQQEGPLLITHWGLSGPAILKLSAWGARELQEMNWHFPVHINWLPELREPELKGWFDSMRKQKATQKVVGKNELGLPSRLWTFLAYQSGVKDDMNWADLPATVRNRFIANLTIYPCEVKGKTTFKEEFVTAGGIKTSEVDVNTMMSKKVPGLFFAGEVLDVDGVTGGFNFQHAWTSGYIAAKAASIF